MRLDKVEFTNFRCFRSEVLEFGRYTSLVGPNNCGKSTALRALSIFFGGSAKSNTISSADFYIGTEEEEELSLKFQFSGVEGEAANELGHYVRNGRVTFELKAQRNSGIISVQCKGIRHGIPALAQFFAATRAGDRRPIYDQLRAENGDELPVWRNMADAEAAVRAFEAARPDQHIEIPSEENAYGATGPVPILRKYIDWIYVPAVKDASTEASEQRESAFSKLILFAVRNRCNFAEQLNEIRDHASVALQKVLAGSREIMTEVGGEIDREFKNLTTTPIDVAIEWGPIEGISVREPVINSVFKDGRVFGPPEVFGHGLQRTYLMALLSLASRVQKADVNFQLLLGIEEPELYQHPPQGKFLSSALADLSAGNCQVIVTTHSPHFVSGRTFESIRSLRKRENITQVSCWTIDQQRDYCAQRKGVAPIGAGAALSGMDRSLQGSVAELFFAGKVVLVEGVEDTAIIESYLAKRGMLSAFYRSGCHFVAAGGKTKMPMLIALCRGFSIEIFSLFDLDMDKPAENQANDEMRTYAADVGDEIPNIIDAEFHGNLFFGWYGNIQSTLASEIDNWDAIKQQIAQQWGWQLVRMDKDPMLLSETVGRVYDARGDLLPLRRVVERLEVFWSQ
ncbi:ATP-dependent nuclease [Mesorhizobium sp. ZC-5]|uniref:ATP-dependent nuclease n=1 Tax=Mesorhizobium sp. ZC-5 TaxID=2986066 RepID=UPI0021E76D90|nr:AAA family ATPase [Mesorhizobium sp. ZC-5]MCV3239782.1 AAA family ATPase [Mesorhizobium sp. ZC-5]